MRKIKKISKLCLESLILFICLFILNNLFNYLDLSGQKQVNELNSTSVENKVNLSQNDNNDNKVIDNLKHMKLHYIDVGEGDSIFYRTA